VDLDGGHERVAYLGIEALGQPLTEANRHLVQGQRVWVELDAPLRDGDGRLPAYLIRRGSPREEVVREAEEIGAYCLVIGSHSKRSVFDLGGTAGAICQRAPAIVVIASPAQ
jgi:nucleotide-binding universal stress UspA family protein